MTIEEWELAPMVCFERLGSLCDPGGTNHSEAFSELSELLSLLEIDHTEVSVSKGTMYNILEMLEDLLYYKNLRQFL